MKRNDAEFETELRKDLAFLAPDSKRSRGFSEELMRRIEARIDETESKSKWRSGAALGSLCTLMIAVAVALSFALNDRLPSESIVEEWSSPTTLDIRMEESKPVVGPPSFQSGLLIGLRSDDKETSYRTMYIASNGDRPRVLAQGSGILVPYKRDFWRIDALRHDTGTDRNEFFVARPATARAPAADDVGAKLFADDPNEAVTLTEKIVFAANQYVSIVESREVSANGDRSATVRAWTTTIPALAASREPVALDEALAQAASELSEQSASPVAVAAVGGQWAVERHQGRWIAMIADVMPLSAKVRELWQPVEAPLPPAVVNHDVPCCAWGEMTRRFPDMNDLFSSPGNDMTVIVTDSRLLVYGNADTLSGEPALTVRLAPNESVIMAQWATDHYVDEWAQKTAQLLK